MHAQRVGLLVVAVVGVIACMLPWMNMHVGSAGLGAMIQANAQDQTSSGLDHGWRGWLTLGIFVAVGVIACIPNQSRPLHEWQPWVVVGLSAVAFVNCLHLLIGAMNASSQMQKQMGAVENNPMGALITAMMPDIRVEPAIGLWLATLSAPVLAGIALLFLGRSKTRLETPPKITFPDVP